MNNKGYQQVIEWEYIDVLTSHNTELAVGILLYLIDFLKQKKELNKLYKFEVISYGWIGYYPAIGIQFLSKDSINLDEEYIDEEFHRILNNSNLIEFINYAQLNYIEIKNIKNKILKRNGHFED